MVAAAATLGLLALNLAGVNKKACYVILGIILWVSVLKSGVHATLAGVVAAFFIPLKAKGEGSMLSRSSTTCTFTSPFSCCRCLPS